MNSWRPLRLGGIRAARVALAATAVLALASVLLLTADPDRDAGPRAAIRIGTAGQSGPPPGFPFAGPAELAAADLPRVPVSVAAAKAITIPASFLGVSTEYFALPLFERHTGALERYLSLLHASGDGPLLLRIGGDSADRSFWDPGRGATPRWVFKLGPGWLVRTRALVRALKAKVILDLNLVTDSPLEAAEWAREAEGVLPRGSIAGFEIGNEPDLYDRTYWVATTARKWLPASPVPLDMSPEGYATDFEVYARLLSRVAPKVPLIGPAIGHPVLDGGWIASLLEAPHTGLRVVSAHWYPYSACVPRDSPGYPTIGRVLGANAARAARALEPVIRLVHRAGLRFRVDEVNSVTCGGRRGVSNSFATALWAPNALFDLARAGVDGVNVHVRVHAINAPFAVTRHGLYARPLLYGLILFARTLGPDSRLLHVRLRASRALGMEAWAVRVRPDRLHVLLIDRSSHAVSVSLRLPARGPATVQRLLAPSIRSTSGVTLDGQSLGGTGAWQGRPQAETVVPGARGYQLTVPGASAALVSARLR